MFDFASAFLKICDATVVLCAFSVENSELVKLQAHDSSLILPPSYQ